MICNVISPGETFRVGYHEDGWRAKIAGKHLVHVGTHFVGPVVVTVLWWSDNQDSDMDDESMVCVVCMKDDAAETIKASGYDELPFHTPDEYDKAYEAWLVSQLENVRARML